jgi:hypothetical protein
MNQTKPKSVVRDGEFCLDREGSFGALCGQTVFDFFEIHPKSNDIVPLVCIFCMLM